MSSHEIIPLISFILCFAFLFFKFVMDTFFHFNYSGFLSGFWLPVLLCGHFIPLCYDGFAYIRFYLVLPLSRLSFLAQFYLLRNLLLIPCVWGAFVCFTSLWPFFVALLVRRLLV